ncbi:KH domain-containing protein [Aphelenchoides besseyi]|nr:KH domain-containing protein [Aphelenchoides besseyi]
MDDVEHVIENLKKEMDDEDDIKPTINVQCTPHGRGDAKTQSQGSHSSPTGSADAKLHDEEDTDSSLPPATKPPIYIPRVIREGGAASMAFLRPVKAEPRHNNERHRHRRRAGALEPVLSPLDRSGWTPPSFRRSLAANGIHPLFPTSPRGHRLTPILEVPQPMPPLHVIYSNGVPNDVGFSRRGGQQRAFCMSAKIYIPEVKGYNFIGRILGPRGISVRHLESETTCKILIRGRGSVKDPRRQEMLMRKEGWSHLHDDLHVLVTAFDDSNTRCRERLEYAVNPSFVIHSITLQVGSIQRLLTPQYDEYKRQQLMQLAIINGTYRP